jgi:hypothetical protein
MTKAALKDQVGRNVFSYVDEKVVMSKKKDAYISDLAETFTNMRKARLKSNLKKIHIWDHRGQGVGMLSISEWH